LRWNIGYALISISDHLTLPTLAGPALLLDYAAGLPKSVVDAGLGYSTGPWELDLQGRWQWEDGTSALWKPFTARGSLLSAHGRRDAGKKDSVSQGP
jgi:hypothetical protein